MPSSKGARVIGSEPAQALGKKILEVGLRLVNEPSFAHAGTHSKEDRVRTVLPERGRVPTGERIGVLSQDNT